MACEIPLGGFEVRNNIALTVTVYIALFKMTSKVNFRGKDYVSHVL